MSLYLLDANSIPVRRLGAVHNHASHTGKNHGKAPHARSCFAKAINGRPFTRFWIGTAETVEDAKLAMAVSRPDSSGASLRPAERPVRASASARTS